MAVRRLVTETSYLDTFVDDANATTARMYVDRVSKSVHGNTFAHHRTRNHVARRILSSDALWKRTTVPGVGSWLPTEDKTSVKEGKELPILASEWICRGSYLLVLLMHVDEVLSRSRRTSVGANVAEVKKQAAGAEAKAKDEDAGSVKGAKGASGGGDGSASAA